MLVIGKTNDGFILEMTKQEINKLCGFFYTTPTAAQSLEIGDSINVAAMYEQLTTLSRKVNKVTGIIVDLRDIANTLELKDPIIKALIVEEPPPP